MNTTDIEALIADLRQPGGDERELSDRVAVALGWTYHGNRPAVGLHGWLSPKVSDDGCWHWAHAAPLYVDDISALLRTLPKGYLWQCGELESRSYGGVRYSAAGSAVIMENAPTAARALCIARLDLLRRTGR